MRLQNLFHEKQPIVTWRQPYIIAEAGVNHEGKMELARRLIAEAKEGGADAIKFQTYRANTLASRHSPAYWDRTQEKASSQFELFSRYDCFWKREYEELKRYCDDLSIEFLSTPFDLESATFLNDLVDVFKISSSDLTNKPFIEYIAGFGKPIILSTGAAYIHEIEEAIQWIDTFGVPAALLHCVLSYPTASRDANLGMIVHLRQKFPDRIIGYSDHTLATVEGVLEIAFLLGAQIIEKHFTYNKALPGNDHYHAMDKKDLGDLRKELESSVQLIGQVKKTSLAAESQARRFARRSLVTAKAIVKGAEITESDVTWKRPGTGISPKCVQIIVGKKARRNIPEDTLIQWQDLR